MNLSRIAILCAAAGMVCGPAVHADSTWVVSGGAEADEDSSYRANLGLNWSPVEPTVLSLAAGRADTATDVGDFTRTSALLAADHFFDPVGVTGQVRWADDTGLLTSRALGGSLYLKRSGWRFAVHGEVRDSDFDVFDFEAIIPVRLPGGLTPLPVSGRADCSLDNTGYGLSLSRHSGVWYVSAGAMAYGYSDNRCDIDNVVLPPQLAELPVLSREIFRRIAARTLNATGQFIGSQLTRENGLLDSSVALGLQYQAGTRIWGLDYYHDREEFAGLKSNTAVGSVTFPVGGRMDLELRAGATDGDITGTVAFAGASFYLYLGGS